MIMRGMGRHLLFFWLFIGRLIVFCVERAETWEGKLFFQYANQTKTADFATSCVFCSVRASMIHHSRKLALRLKHFARWRKLARTFLRKPRRYRPACSFCLRNVMLLLIFTVKASIPGESSCAGKKNVFQRLSF